MSQEPRTSQGRATVVYIRAAMFTLLSDPADRAQAELVLGEVSRRVALTEDAAADEALEVPDDERPPVLV